MLFKYTSISNESGRGRSRSIDKTLPMNVILVKVIHEVHVKIIKKSIWFWQIHLNKCFPSYKICTKRFIVIIR